jgi:DNA-binding HxlR family transcriptional regulator
MNVSPVALARLLALCHRRWALAVLAALAGRPGVRFVELQRRLGVSGGPLRECLDGLLAAGHLATVGGHGHPLRPEYELGPRRAELAAAAAALVTAVPRSARTLVSRKWTLPILVVLDEGELRFAELAARLPGASPRALALALRALATAGLIRRRVGAEHPPTVRYGLSATGRRLAPALAELLAALAALPGRQ